MLFCIVFFNISAMQLHPLQISHEHVLILLQHLVGPDKKNSVIIFPIKTNDLKDEKIKRRKSEEELSGIALNAVRISLLLDSQTAGKSFLIMGNCDVVDYERQPAHSQGMLCKQVKKEVIKNVIDCSSISPNSSFIIYNMPYCKQDEGWRAYSKDLEGLLYYQKEPCLILIDEDIYSSDITDEIYKKFHGKKKVLEYEKLFQKLKEYQPSFLSETSFPMMAFCAGVVVAGLFYFMPSGLTESLTINS